MSRNLNTQNTELNKIQENNYHFNNQFDIVDRNTRPKTNYSTPIRQKLPPGNDYVMMTNKSSELYLPYNSSARQIFKKNKFSQEKEKEKLPEIRQQFGLCK